MPRGRAAGKRCPPKTQHKPPLPAPPDIVVSRETTVAILADLEARYDAVLSALARIEEKKYGKCEVCGEAIEAARLEANPAATTCTTHL